MFIQDKTVRYSEIGPEGYADVAQVLTWFQDAATDHSEHVGYGADVLHEKGLAWIVLHWDVRVTAFPRYNQNIQVATWASGFSSAYGHRMFTLKDEEGNILATAESVWILYDMVKNKFCKVSDEMSARYACTEKMPAEVLRKWKSAPPEEILKTVDITVKRSDTDTNRHTNNVSYVRFLTDSLENGGAVKHTCVTYKKSLFLGEQAQLQIGKDSAAMLRDGEVCTLYTFE